MLDGNYKNLSIDPSFSDALSSVNARDHVELTPTLIEQAKLISEKISSPTYFDSPTKDILEAFRSHAPEDKRYDQDWFKAFEQQLNQK